jgi:serine/threonine-protein kinase
MMELAGRYRVESELGQGGMGSVHRAFDRTTGGCVAIKLLNPSLVANPAAAARFAREA